MNTLITGASGNLGKATLEKFLSEGANIIALTSARGLGYKANGKVTTYPADLTNESDASTAIGKVIADHKTIDVALLLVGGFAAGNVEKTDGAMLRKMFAINFETAYYIARPVFQQMVAQGGGRIVFVASKTSFVNETGKNFIAYSLSKSLVSKLAELLNAEGASKNVVCSVIAPSTIDSEENRRSMPNADFSKWVQPEVIANTLYFLVSRDGAPLREPVIKIYGNS
jgi:NAD(P)-dependent dehydrogenase (short-subunit alcohol dehydrogenase family)